MFHIRTSLITGIVTLLCLTAQPTSSYANGPTSPAAQAQTQPTYMASEKKLTDMSMSEIRQSSRTKLSGTKQWVKDQPAVEGFKGFVEDMGQATDNLQDSAAPLGRSIKSSINASLPGQTLAQKADKTFSVFGLLLMLAFGLVVLLMSFSGPMSRIGGR